MTAPTENRPGQGDSTYEEFTNQPFYVDVNRTTISLAPPSQRVIDVATGTGAIITQLLEQNKLLPGFEVHGYDTDSAALGTARKKFSDYSGQIFFEEAFAENLQQEPAGEADLVTFCNAIHLTETITSFQEAARVLKPGRPLILNSAYTNDLAYPSGSRRTWGIMVSLAKRIAHDKYGLEESKDHPSQDILKYSSEDYKRLAEEAGFTNISIGRINVRMTQEDLEAICRYKEFTEGALPGIDYDIARDCLLEAVPEMLARRKETDSITRGWMVMYAFKTSDSEMDELPNPEEKRDQISLSDARSIY
ncbi:MAG: class I SAM-dependent methyltransferase [Patescibacteria group bacterium]